MRQRKKVQAVLFAGELSSQTVIYQPLDRRCHIASMLSSPAPLAAK
jgi:hypothetical protein